VKKTVSALSMARAAMTASVQPSARAASSALAA
jgi:hypothetical protein